MVDHSLRFWRRLLMLLLPAATLVLLALVALVSLAFQGQTALHQGGFGGALQANGASFSVPTGPATASPVPTPTPAPQGTLYGGKGLGGTCSNPVGGGPIAAIVQQDFGWSPDHLSPRYRHDTVDLLCNDFWAWFSPDGDNVPASQVLQTLHWPADLFASPWSTSYVHVSWMAISFPTTPTNGCPHNDNCGVPKDNPACFYSPQIGGFQPTFNLCDPIRSAINATANAMAQGYRQLMGKGFGDPHAALAFVWATPTAPFEDDKVSGLLTLWNASWGIVLLCITAVVAWGALRSMLGSVVSWLAYAQVMELLPRLLFALLAALLSKTFFLMLIQANNALSLHFSNTIFQTIVEHQNPGIKLGIIQILYGVLGYALIIEEAARLAFLYVLFAGSPILFFLAALPETQRWAQSSAVAAILLTFLQAIQAFLMDVGNSLLTSILHEQSGSLTFLQILVALAVLYLTLTMFFAMLRVAFGPGGYALAGFPLLSLAVARWVTRGTRQATWAANRANNAAIGMATGGIHPQSRPAFRGARFSGRGGLAGSGSPQQPGGPGAPGPRPGPGPGGSGGPARPGAPRFTTGGPRPAARPARPTSPAGRPTPRNAAPLRGRGHPVPPRATRSAGPSPTRTTPSAPGTPQRVRPQGFAGAAPAPLVPGSASPAPSGPPPSSSPSSPQPPAQP